MQNHLEKTMVLCEATVQMKQSTLSKQETGKELIFGALSVRVGSGRNHCTCKFRMIKIQLPTSLSNSLLRMHPTHPAKECSSCTSPRAATVSSLTKTLCLRPTEPTCMGHVPPTIKTYHSPLEESNKGEKSNVIHTRSPLYDLFI